MFTLFVAIQKLHFLCIICRNELAKKANKKGAIICTKTSTINIFAPLTFSNVVLSYFFVLAMSMHVRSITVRHSGHLNILTCRYL